MYGTHGSHGNRTEFYTCLGLWTKTLEPKTSSGSKRTTETGGGQTGSPHSEDKHLFKKSEDGPESKGGF